MFSLALLVTLAGSVLSQFTEPTSIIPHEDIKIRLYYDETISFMTWTLGEAVDLFSHKYYNTSLPLLMVVHGYDLDQDTLIHQTVTVLYSRQLQHQYNILAVDLPEQFSFNLKNFYYFKPAFSVPVAGDALGGMLNTAIGKDLVTPDQINLIAFSLGAQVAGYIGRSVQGLINSISGIDPAGFGFDFSNLLTRLVHVSKEDAKFVHLYHSNSAFMGTSRRLGTADYLFNDGDNQPGCNPIMNPLCSHLRGFLLYHEALKQNKGLPSVQCNSLNHLVHCKCQGNRFSYVGFPIDTSAHGVFVLRTLMKAPYSLGSKGVMGNKCKKSKTAYEEKLSHRYDKIMHLA